MTLPFDPAIRTEARPQPRRLRRWRRLAAMLAVLTAFAGAGWWARADLLHGLAEAWIVSDPPAAADAVAVLGGGLDTRPFAAAEYYRKGLVKEVLVSNNREGRAARLGVGLADSAAARAVLLQLGVPVAAIHDFGAGLANTHEEALALRDWAAAHHLHTILVPTEIFSSRRVRWTLDHVLGDAVAVSVPALDPPDYGAADWWRNEQGVISFQNEVIKYAYYRLHY